MGINEQSSHQVSHCLLYGSKLGIAWSSTRIRQGWSPVLFTSRKLIKSGRSMVNILEQGWPYIWRMFFVVSSLPTAVCLELPLIIPPQITRWHASCNQPLRPLESSGLHWGTTYLAWHTSYSRVLGAFMSSLSVKGRTRSWAAHLCDRQSGENESVDIGNSQRLRKEGNTWINMVSAMRPGLAKIIETVRISGYVESAETDLHIADNA